MGNGQRFYFYKSSLFRVRPDYNNVLKERRTENAQQNATALLAQHQFLRATVSDSQNKGGSSNAMCSRPAFQPSNAMHKRPPSQPSNEMCSKPPLQSTNAMCARPPLQTIQPSNSMCERPPLQPSYPMVERSALQPAAVAARKLVFESGKSDTQPVSSSFNHNQTSLLAGTKECSVISTSRNYELAVGNVPSTSTSCVQGRMAGRAVFTFSSRIRNPGSYICIL